MKARRRRRKRDLDNNSKPAVVAVVICAIAVLLIGRLFSLQVIHGREYLTEFQDSIQRPIMRRSGISSCGMRPARTRTAMRS